MTLTSMNTTHIHSGFNMDMIVQSNDQSNTGRRMHHLNISVPLATKYLVTRREKTACPALNLQWNQQFSTTTKITSYFVSLIETLVTISV